MMRFINFDSSKSFSSLLLTTFLWDFHLSFCTWRKMEKALETAHSSYTQLGPGAWLGSQNPVQNFCMNFHVSTLSRTLQGLSFKCNLEYTLEYTWAFQEQRRKVFISVEIIESYHKDIWIFQPTPVERNGEIFNHSHFYYRENLLIREIGSMFHC